MGSLIHILHLEDDPMDGELIEAKLKEADLPCRITREEGGGVTSCTGTEQRIDPCNLN